MDAIFKMADIEISEITFNLNLKFKMAAFETNIPVNHIN